MARFSENHDPDHGWGTSDTSIVKMFDLVYVMTGGNFETDVIANRMYQEMYVNFETGRSAAIAIVLLVLIIPVLIYNVKRFQEQEAIR